MKGVIRRAELLAKFKEDRHSNLGQIESGLVSLPRTQRRRQAEHVRALTTHRVPVHDREAQMIAHRLALDDLAGVVMFEGQRVSGFGTFELNFRDIGKCGHNVLVNKKLAKCADSLAKAQARSVGNDDVRARHDIACRISRSKSA